MGLGSRSLAHSDNLFRLMEYISTYILTMEFEWDDAKNRQNVHKHLISFEEAKTIFDGDVLTVVDNRVDYGEVRFLSLGSLDLEVGSIVIVAAHTDRGHKTRIISARRANRRERKQYDEFI